MGYWGSGSIYSASVEGGLIYAGAGGTASAGAGVFGGGQKGTNLGAFASVGGFAGGPGYGYSYPASNNSNNFAAGAFAGRGGGLFLSNATSASDISGPFDTRSLNVGVGPVLFSLQVGISNGT